MSLLVLRASKLMLFLRFVFLNLEQYRDGNAMPRESYRILGGSIGNTLITSSSESKISNKHLMFTPALSLCSPEFLHRS